MQGNVFIVLVLDYWKLRLPALESMGIFIIICFQFLLVLRLRCCFGLLEKRGAVATAVCIPFLGRNGKFYRSPGGTQNSSWICNTYERDNVPFLVYRPMHGTIEPLNQCSALFSAKNQYSLSMIDQTTKIIVTFCPKMSYAWFKVLSSHMWTHHENCSATGAFRPKYF